MKTPLQRKIDVVVRFVAPTAVVTTLIGVALYVVIYMRVLVGMQVYEIPPDVLDRFREFTGLAYGLDREFGPAAATIVAQTVLSLFITITAFVLILFLVSPSRVFTGWTEVSGISVPRLWLWVYLPF